MQKYKGHFEVTVFYQHFKYAFEIFVPPQIEAQHQICHRCTKSAFTTAAQIQHFLLLNGDQLSKIIIGGHKYSYY